MLPHQIEVPDNLKYHPIYIKPVFEIAKVFGPPVLFALKLDVFSFFEIVYPVGSGIRFDFPIEFSYKILVEFAEKMTGGRTYGNMQMKIRFGLCSDHCQSMIIIYNYPVYFPGVIVIVKRCHDELGAHKLNCIGKIMGSHRFAVGPAGFFVQFEIHGFLVFAEGPMGCQLGNDIFSIWMDPYEPELIASHDTGEAVVGIRTNRPEGRWKTE